MEVRTWEQEVLEQAPGEGWDVGPAIPSESCYYLKDAAARKKAAEVILKEQPDFLVMAFSRKPWSVLQNLAKHQDKLHRTEKHL
jgi:hypothetical protein